MPALSPQRWRELSPQIDHLLTLPPDERLRFLDELASNDHQTATELQELLSRLDALASSSFLAGVAFEGLQHPAATAGQVLGAWTLESPLGEGGMGTVWRAQRSDGRFEGFAAVKLLNAAPYDAAAQARFQREGAVLARLRHPGIAALLDAGVYKPWHGEGRTQGNGQPYLVLELVEGLPIDRWCQEQQLDVRERVGLVVQVLDAVAAAHAQLVLHRDLKPANILVQADGRARLLDFGIARLIDEAGVAARDGSAALTREGALALTPRYAAPEQVTGTDLSTATDVFQLGVVMYELLCGQHPSGLTDSGALEHLRALATPFETPPSRHAGAARRELAGDLDTIVMKALAPLPHARYASVAAMADDLRRHLAHQPIAARPASWTYTAGRWLQRNRALALVAAIGGAAATAGAVGTLQQAQVAASEAATAQREKTAAEHSAKQALQSRALAEQRLADSLRQRDAAERERQRADSESQRARAAAVEAGQQREQAEVRRREAAAAGEAATRERDRALFELDNAETINGFFSLVLGEGGTRAFTNAELLARALEIVERRPPSDAAQKARLLLMLGHQHILVQDWRSARPLLERASEMARGQGDNHTAARARCASASAAFMAGERQSAERLLDQEIEALRAQRPPDALGLVDCLYNRSGLGMLARRGAAARQDAEEALSLIGPAPRPAMAAQLPRLQSVRAAALNTQNLYPEAVGQMEQLLSQQRSAGASGSSQFKVHLTNLGVILFNIGLDRRAAEVLDEAWQLDQRLTPEGGSSVLPGTLAVTLSRLGRHAEALEMATAALRTAARSGPTTEGIVHERMARVACEARQLDLCEQHVAEASSRLDAQSGRPRHPNFISVELLQARLALLRGELDRARTLFEALERRARQNNSKGGGAVDLYLLHAELARALGEPDAAGRHLEQAHELARQLMGNAPHSSYMGRVLLAQAELAAYRNGPTASLAGRARVQLTESLGPDQVLSQRAAALAAVGR